MPSKYNYSRPFNSQWVCKYAQFDKLLDELYVDIVSTLGYKHRPTATKEAEIKRHVSAIILDLYRAYQADDELYLAISKTAGFYSKKSR